MTTNGGEHLRSLLARAVALRGDAPFLSVGGVLCSARELERRAIGTARGLVRAGFRPGDRLAIHVDRCLDEVVALLAATLASGLAVPVAKKLKDEQIRHVLDDADPFAVVTSSVTLASLRDPAGVLGTRRRYAVGAGPVPQSEPFATLDLGEGPLEVPRPHAPAILLYTSGSTGLSKAVVQDHRNLALGAQIVAGYLHLGTDDHVLAVLPFSFDYGLNQLLAAMHAGARVTAADFLSLGELKALLSTVRPTGLAGVPSLWHEVARGLQTGALDARDGASLRYVTNSGGRLAEPDLRTLRTHWPHVDVFAMYGLTEAFRSAFLDPREIDAHPDSFGRALPGVELLLVDPHTGAVLEGEATGELVHAGALVSLGYWNRPEATAMRFRADPRGRPGTAVSGTVVYSGDLVRRDAEGRHYFVARMDRLLKVAGHRISPDEVAQAVLGMQGVGEVAVYGAPGGAQGHRIVVAIGGDERDAELPARVLRQCRARLPAYMVPAAVRVHRTLPHNQNGKIDVVKLEREDPWNAPS